MKKFALIGNKISYSFSPTLHKKIFDTYSLQYKYSLIDQENLKEIIKYIKDNHIEGFNVTIPYKEQIINFLDFISPEAKDIGAVNCVNVKNGKLYGYNTDYLGIIDTFNKMNIDLKNKKVYILGSGGAAKASCKAVLDCEGIPIVVSRKKLISFPPFNIKCITYDELKKEKGELLINATPVGTFPNLNQSPISKEHLENFDFLLDLIYNPKETQLLKFGNSLNKICENGLFMLISQGVNSEKIWNNIDIDTNLIYKKLLPIIYEK